MIQNIKAAFGKGQGVPTGSRTEFTEMAVPFTISNGVASTTQATLQSPFLSVLAIGKADLVNEILDFRVEPKVVKKLASSGQGESVFKCDGTGAGQRHLLCSEIFTGSRIVGEAANPGKTARIR